MTKDWDERDKEMAKGPEKMMERLERLMDRAKSSTPLMPAIYFQKFVACVVNKDGESSIVLPTGMGETLRGKFVEVNINEVEVTGV